MSAPTAPAAFASPAELAAYMRVDVAELDQAQAQQALAAASGSVRSYCRWNVAAVVGGRMQVDTGDSGGPCLMLPALNVTTVTSVSITAWNGGPETPVTDYVLFEDAGYLRRGRGGWPTFARVTVLGDYGFTPIPDVVAGVTKSVASRNLATAGMGPVSQYRVDGVSTTYGKNADVTDTAVLLLPAEQAALDAFRIPLAS